jgi:hypothetical protein
MAQTIQVRVRSDHLDVAHRCIYAAGRATGELEHATRRLRMLVTGTGRPLRRYRCRGPARALLRYGRLGATSFLMSCRDPPRRLTEVHSWSRPPMLTANAYGGSSASCYVRRLSDAVRSEKVLGRETIVKIDAMPEINLQDLDHLSKGSNVNGGVADGLHHFAGRHASQSVSRDQARSHLSSA